MLPLYFLLSDQCSSCAPGKKEDLLDVFSGYKNDKDLTEVIRDIVSVAGGEAGGHMNAAGAMITTANEEAFIETAKNVFGKF